MKLNIQYHPNQSKLLFGDKHRFKVVPKGRRFGMTRGMANYFIEEMLDGVTPLLWVDTVNTNIDRYIERYFKPILKQLPQSMWSWRVLRKELTINGAVCDFRSADRPENLEGFGYRKIFLNEAGIILKNRFLWEESIRPMAMDYEADCIIGGTPKGKKSTRDRKEHLFCTMARRGADPDFPDWSTHQFSSYDNPYIKSSEVRLMEMEIPAGLRDQEVHGRFVDTEMGEIFHRHWWRYYDTLPTSFTQIILSWDTAFKKNEENDFNVCQAWGQAPTGFYLIGMWKQRAEYPELKRAFVDQYLKYSPSVVLVEDKASGISLIQEVQRDTTIPVKPILPDRDKVARAHAVTPIIEAGACFLPDPAKNPWVEDFITTCEDFPNVEFDDDVDAMTQALNYLKTSPLVIPIILSRDNRLTSSMLKGYA